MKRRFTHISTLLWCAALIPPGAVAQSRGAAPAETRTRSSESPTAVEVRQLADAINHLELDPQQVYLVRDLSLRRDEIKIFFNEGYLVFSRPVTGRPIIAIFTGAANFPGEAPRTQQALPDAEDSVGESPAAPVAPAAAPSAGELEEIADGEVLILPPRRSERQSMARFTGRPNLDEHFQVALLAFTDESARDLLSNIATGGRGRPAPEAAPVLIPRWSPVAANLAGSLAQRLVTDLMSPAPYGGGFMFAAISSPRVGNFDVIYDPLGEDSISVGRLTARNNFLTHEIWTGFPSRSTQEAALAGTQSPYELSDYRIRATIDRELQITATTKAVLQIGIQPVRAMPFALSRAETVKSARIDGQPAEVLYREINLERPLRPDENDTFVVVASGVLEAGSKHQIEFDHSGGVIEDHGSQVFSVGARANWYPRSGVEFAHYEMEFRYPDEVTLVSVGDVVEEHTEDGWHTTLYRTSVPIRLAGFNLGNYKGITTTNQGLSVRVYGNRGLDPALEPRAEATIITQRTPGFGRTPPSLTTTAILRTPVPPDPSGRLEAVANDVSQSLNYYAEIFGPPPLKTLTVSPIPGTTGQGFPGLIYLSTLSYLEPEERPKTVRDARTETFFSDLMVAHEVAHQWWGNVVTGESYRDDWLMEGLAHYASLLYLEHKQGREAMLKVLNDYRSDLLAAGDDDGSVESFGPLSWGYRLDAARTPNGGRIITYEKGSWVFHMLRDRMGDANFFSWLKAAQQKFRFQGVTTEQLRDLAKQFLPAGTRANALDVFFENWVDSIGVPKLEVTTRTTNARTGAVQIALKQSRVDDDFSIDVPVEIQDGANRTTLWIRTGEGNSSATYTPRRPSAPLAKDAIRIPASRILQR